MKNIISFYQNHFKIETIYLLFLIFFTISYGLEDFNSSKSDIYLIIKDKGEHFILNNSFYLDPFEVIINGQIQNISNKKSFNLESVLNNITIKFDRQINSFRNMFSGLTNIIEIDLSNLDTSKVTTMEEMFNGCINLEKINFGNINTSLVSNMNYLFHNCTKLESINVSNFDTSSVTDIQYLFSHCISLISIDVSNFNTSKIQNMLEMFGYCSKLQTINVSNFDTSKVTNIKGMFYNCTNLKYLDLSNFETSLFENIQSTVRYCNSLVYLNLYKFKINNKVVKYVFLGDISDLKVCINDSETRGIIYSDYNGLTYNCSDECFINNIKVDLKANKCIKNCNESEYKYEYNNICFQKCPDKTYSLISNKYLCLDINKIPTEGYYLDLSDNIYKKCYETCKNCYGEGNKMDNKCSLCINNYDFIDELKNNNCYERCRYFYYFDELNNYMCTLNETCQENYKLINEKNKCINECKFDDIYKYEFKNVCYERCPSKTIQNGTICKEVSKEDESLLKLKEKCINIDVISNVSQTGIDYIVKDENSSLIGQVTTTKNQKINKDKNISNINLNGCESILREKYNINDSFPLIILKIDFKPDDTIIPIILYEIYHPVNYSKLDLSYCKNETFSLNIPAYIDKNYEYLYDPNSDFYKDKCFAYTTEDGTDIILNDRRQEFKDKNLSLCEINCEYISYNNEQSSCECAVKQKMELISEIVNNQNKLSNNFDRIDNSSNFGVSSIKMISCTKTLFSKEGLLTNISSYILIFFILFFLLSITIFIKCGYQLINNEINEILREKEIAIKNINLTTLGEGEGKSGNNKFRKKKKSSKMNNSFLPRKKIKHNSYLINSKNISKSGKGNNLLNIDCGGKKNKKSFSLETKNFNLNSNLNIGSSINNKKNNNTIRKNCNNKEILVDYELNNFSYDAAIKIDKRTFFEYYYSLIKIKHPIIFTFCPIKDYNAIIIKLDITCISFSIYYFVNFLFFNDEIIHDIYINRGKYNLTYFLPKIVISFLISHALTIIIKLIFLSERNILQIKKQPTYNKAYHIIDNVKRKIVIKYIIFFISGLIFLSFFWMSLSSFCAVYQNTQVILFENTLISYVISLVYPFFINFLTSILRISGINSKYECLYNSSRILQYL